MTNLRVELLLVFEAGDEQPLRVKILRRSGGVEREVHTWTSGLPQMTPSQFELVLAELLAAVRDQFLVGPSTLVALID